MVRTSLNKELFNNAKLIMEYEEGGREFFTAHIGWHDVGIYIDWLEENYTITKKEGKI